MRWVFASCLNAIVAAGAVPGNTDVIEVRWQPASGGMAIITVIVTGNMSWVFACCCNAIVTRSARSDDLRMVDRRRRYKSTRIVAILANIGRLNMAYRLADGIDSVVTARAIIDDADVIKIGRAPRYRGVTVVTNIAAWHVRWVFSSRDYAVMTAVAGTNDLGMVNGKDRCKKIRRVAILADIACLNMRRIFAGCLNAIVAIDTVTSNVYVIKIGR